VPHTDSLFCANTFPYNSYIYAAEARLREAEALLGVFLCSDDASIRDVVSNMNNDPTARSIIGRVNLGRLGPLGRQGATDALRFTSTRKQGNNPLEHEPSYIELR